jgi:hypothetical protein
MLKELLEYLEEETKRIDSESCEGSWCSFSHTYNKEDDFIGIVYDWSTYNEGATTICDIQISLNKITLLGKEDVSSVYGDYDNELTFQGSLEEFKNYFKEAIG